MYHFTIGYVTYLNLTNFESDVASAFICIQFIHIGKRGQRQRSMLQDIFEQFNFPFYLIIPQNLVRVVWVWEYKSSKLNNFMRVCNICTYMYIVHWYTCFSLLIMYYQYYHIRTKMVTFINLPHLYSHFQFFTNFSIYIIHMYRTEYVCVTNT